MILTWLSVIALSLALFAAGVWVGTTVTRMTRPRRSLPPLDDSYRRPASQLHSIIFKPTRPITWGSKRVP